MGRVVKRPATKQQQDAARNARTVKAGKVEPKAKRQKQEDTLTGKCSDIAAMLHSAESFPPEVLRMLSLGVRSCLSTPKESRHGVQNSVLEMIDEVGRSVEAGHTAKVAALTGKAGEAYAERAKRKAAAEAATAAMKERVDAVEAAKVALRAATEETSAASLGLSVAMSEHRSGDLELAKMNEKKNLLESTASGLLKDLVGGSVAHGAELIMALIQVGRDIGLEKQLLTSAAPVLSRPPEARGSFDKMVLQELEQQFGKEIESSVQQLADGESGKAERTERVEAAKGTLNLSQGREESCKKELEAAELALRDAEGPKVTSETCLKDLDPEMEKAAADAEAANALLAACQGVLATCRQLVEGPPEAPPEASPEAPEGAAASAAPAPEPKADEPAEEAQKAELAQPTETAEA